jgi:hypothetical protein
MIMTGKRILLLNLLLLAGILICAEELLSGWQKFESEKNLDQVLKRGLPESGPATEGLRTWGRAENLQHDFFIVAEKDLFSPERRPEVIDAAEEAAEQAPEFPKRPSMNGVAEQQGERVAFLTTYESPKDNGRMEEVRLGDLVQGYVVTEITDTTLTLTWNDYDVLIDMLDSESATPAVRVPPKVASLNIIRIGSKVAAVESTAPETAETEQSRGLQVGIVGSQTTGGTAGRTGLSGRGGTSMGRGSSLGRQGIGGQNRGFPSTFGGLSGSRSGISNQQRRY